MNGLPIFFEMSTQYKYQILRSSVDKGPKLDVECKRASILPGNTDQLVNCNKIIIVILSRILWQHWSLMRT